MTPQEQQLQATTQPATPSVRSRLGRELRTVPNLLSLSRMVLIYVAAGLFLLGHEQIALVCGTIGGLTDYLDGYIARRTNQVTELGAILDRLCDLIFESTWLILATFYHLISPVFLLLYLFREFVVLSARLWCGEHGVKTTSNFIGKLKSNFFGYTAFCVYLNLADVIPYPWASKVLYGLSMFGIITGLVLSYYSAASYLKTFARAYNLKSGEK